MPRESRAAVWCESFVSAALIGLCFATLTVWSWRKWADVLVDFGQQLYIPWRLAHGERLYRDIALMHGPLSQHLNALLFWLFGASFTVLIAANLAVLAAITALVYRVFRHAADRWTATAVCIWFLCIFGFSQYLRTGNYNFVAPYTHESSHGMLLVIGLVWAASRWVATRRRRDGVAAALCFGLALLTKVDVSLAAVAVAAAAVGIAWATREPGGAPGWSDGLAFAAVALAPFLVFVAWFSTYLGPAAAFAAAGTGFSPVARDAASNPLYLRVFGFDDAVGNGVRMLEVAGAIALAVSAAALVDLVIARTLKRAAAAAAVVLGIATAGVLWLELPRVPWNETARALPVTSAIALGWSAVELWRGRADRERRAQPTAMVLWSVLALALLAKMVLNARFDQFGFYLAMPAATLLAVGLSSWIPRALRARFGGGPVFRAVALAGLAAVAAFHLYESEFIYRLKTFPLGQGGNTMLTWGSPQLPQLGPVMAETLKWIDLNTPPDATFAPLPEGITLDYLARRRTTLPVVNFMMTEEILFGEAMMLEAFARQPPDYVLLVQRDTEEFGVGAFGLDPRYGERIMAWVWPRYEPVALFGSDPYARAGFGIKILKRRRSP